MNCERANKIPLESVLHCMGSTALKRHSGGEEIWFENPLRDESTSSFSINVKKNLWQDFGTAEGGTVVDLVMNFTGFCVSDALKWLTENLGNVPAKNTKTPSRPPKSEKKPRFVMQDVIEISHQKLSAYIKERGISIELAREYLKEAHYQDTKTDKKFFGLSLENRAGGYAIRNPFMKNAIAPMDLTFVKGIGTNPDIHVFEGFFDFLSYMMMVEQIKPIDDIIILNSTSMYRRAVNHIANLPAEYSNSRVILWLDNAPQGSNASINILKVVEQFGELNLPVYTANENYADHEDLNAYWKENPRPIGLKPLAMKRFEHS